MPLDNSLFSLPTVIWSGIIAALVSLGGVVLSNKASVNRLKEQLQHDAREKHRDRLASLRKDVYLALVAEVNKANGYLGSLANKDPTEGDFGGPLQSAIAKLAEVQLVGSRESSAAAAELSSLYGEAFLRLTGTAKPIYEAKIDIKISDELYQQNFTQGQRVLAEITAENESGAPNQARLASLFKSFDNYREKYLSHSDDRNIAWKKYNSQQQHFAIAVLEEIRKLGPVSIKLTCAVRDEVGLHTDASELKRRLEKNNERASYAIDELLRKLSPTTED